jgi:glycosyltransferase involved in cell wall biosynthesis
LDVHEEPFSLSTRQWLRAAPADLPVVMYTAQNIDKRFPPPFAGYERRALRRAVGLYPCSRQAASVARTKGFTGSIRVIPLGFDPDLFHPGAQSLQDSELVLGLFGRLVPEKGVREAVRVLARVQEVRPARLIIVGEGPEGKAAVALASQLRIGQRVHVAAKCSPQQVASYYRGVHVVLVPSMSTATWAEQFGRVIVEAQASGAVVAGFASGAIPEVSGPPAVLAPERNVEVLAERVISLIGAPDDWARRRVAGLELAERRTWGRVAAEQMELYSCALTAPAHPTPLRNRKVRQCAANVDFGSPAATPAGPRPFAFPPLRNGGALATLVGAAIDRAEVAGARLPTKKWMLRS